MLCLNLEPANLHPVPPERGKEVGLLLGGSFSTEEAVGEEGSIGGVSPQLNELCDLSCLAVK